MAPEHFTLATQLWRNRSAKVYYEEKGNTTWTGMVFWTRENLSSLWNGKQNPDGPPSTLGSPPIQQPFSESYYSARSRKRCQAEDTALSASTSISEEVWSWLAIPIELKHSYLEPNNPLDGVYPSLSLCVSLPTCLSAA